MHDEIQTPDTPEPDISAPAATCKEDLPVAEPDAATGSDAVPADKYAMAATVAIIDACWEANEPRMASYLIKNNYTLNAARARIMQAAEVRNICKIAKAPELADALVQAGTTPDEAKIATWNYLVERDEKTPIDSTPPPARPKAVRRADFKKMPPAEQRALILSGAQLID
jgi:hypothetical protein